MEEKNTTQNLTVAELFQVTVVKNPVRPELDCTVMQCVTGA